MTALTAKAPTSLDISDAASSEAGAEGDGPERGAAATLLFRLSVGVFFIGGFLTSSVSLLVPQLKLMLSLDYTQAFMVQLAFHASYLLFALPITAFIVGSGYTRAIVAGLVVMSAGCVALAVAQGSLSFALVLGSLLLLSGGQTFLQIASNTVVAVIGPARGAAGRLTLLQGFNSLGTVAGPLLSAPLLLAQVERGREWRPVIGLSAATLPFVLTALVTAVLALAYARHRRVLESGQRGEGFVPARRLFAVLGESRRLRWGTAAIFVYVGAEVTIGGLLPSVLMRPDRLGAGAVTAGQLVALYWGGAMVGRFAGAWIMRHMAEARLLQAAALGAVALTLAASVLPGAAGSLVLVAVGLCNAIMYPTIYALALPEDARAAPVASMWLCMAVVGGAIVPVLTGAVADASGLLESLIVPAGCYVLIAAFAAICRKGRA